MNTKFTLMALLSSSILLSACGGSDSTEDNNIDAGTGEKPSTDVQIQGPISTGVYPDRVFVYFDLETMATVPLTDAEAATNTVWDIAFKGSDIYLNNNDSTNPVSLYLTDNNADFFDVDGNAIATAFIDATPESELADFTAVSADDVPSDTLLFIADSTNSILDGFYNYANHVVTPADDHYFIVNSDDVISKFNVTGITTTGRSIGALTVSYANQGISATEFDSNKTELVIDAVNACASYSGVYIDFDLGQSVSATDAWDVTLPCNADNTAAEFSMNIAADATAIQDFNNVYTGIPRDAIAHYKFQSNQFTELAFKAKPWYQYGLNGGHSLWSQYGVYLIKTSTATYKFQITSYYTAEGVSGNYSFRAEAL